MGCDVGRYDVQAASGPLASHLRQWVFVEDLNHRPVCWSTTEQR